MNQAKPVVSIVRVEDQQTYRAVAEAVELLGGIGRLIPRGARVFVKPNLVHWPGRSGITNVWVLDAVVRLLVEAGAGEVSIGDSPGDFYAPQVYRARGVHHVAERYGAKVVDLNLEPGVKRALPKDIGREYVLIPRAVAEADAVVSVPTFKLWGDNPMSLGLKNWIGLYTARQYGINHNSHEWLPDHPERVLSGEIGVELGAHMPTTAAGIVAMNLALKPTLVVIDAIEGGNGRGQNVPLNLVVAGERPMATDVVGMALAGLDAEKEPNFRFFSAWGLGSCRLADVEVRGVPVEDARFDLRRLDGNVLELPVERCLRALSTAELAQIARTLRMLGLLESAAVPASPDAIPANAAFLEAPDLPTDREGLIGLLKAAIGRPGYYRMAISTLTPPHRDFLRLLVEMGGTSGGYFAIREEFARRQGDGYVFWPSQRAAQRLGLAYAIESEQADSYFVLAEGVAAALAAS